MTARPCLRCGDLTPTGTYCTDCKPPDKSSPRQRGYDSAWDRLAKRAKKLQPWCEDCGATEDLQCDHSPEAWQRHYAGKPIRLKDVSVCCGPCNRARGAARPTPVGVNPTALGPVGKAQGGMNLTGVKS
ncbi:hypothetical protein KUF57_11625 [Mycolicibacterium sp. PAM1]|uniref:hypothetical protein n=1 Tax=Mycolicibacterium sp. PAM1 TaxID=2853535 RepID=UPI001C3D6521|nr:hypothetical protein [Mycolicibacterium sp. PAM1]MBV5244185.1 hypothetical protein [Mycolicibacterium sp. PAM1]